MVEASTVWHEREWELKRLRERCAALEARLSPRPRARRRAISQSTRFAVFERSGFRCVYCGVAAKDAPLHVDHAVPLSKGGADDETNMVAACCSCNLGKGARVLQCEVDRDRPRTVTVVREVS